MLQRYAERSGRDVSMADYYRAWANWKTATVVEQIYVRYVRGQTNDPRFAAWASGRRCWRGRRRESLPNSALGSKSAAARVDPRAWNFDRRFVIRRR